MNRTRLQEAVLFLSGPAQDALDQVEVILRGAGLLVTHRSDWSVAFAFADCSPDASDASPPVAGSHSPGPGTLPPGTGQIAVVPVQVAPGILRGWLTFSTPAPSPLDCHASPNPDGAASGIFDAIVDPVRATSRHLQSIVTAAEKASAAEADWQARASNIRKALTTTGLPTDVIEARLHYLELRWRETHHRAGAVIEDEPPPA
ncbi:MAG: hypothetical protein EXR45_07125 [Chloroflexi bacterium]|nr:hypothetical protein [Chloroflexota bacterium]